MGRATLCELQKTFGVFPSFATIAPPSPPTSSSLQSVVTRPAMEGRVTNQPTLVPQYKMTASPPKSIPTSFSRYLFNMSNPLDFETFCSPLSHSLLASQKCLECFKYR